MSLAVSIVGLLFMMLLNIGGWIWFIASLKLQVSDLAAKVLSHDTLFDALPRVFVPRQELQTQAIERDKLEAARDKRAERMEGMLMELLGKKK